MPKQKPGTPAPKRPGCGDRDVRTIVELIRDVATVEKLRAARAGLEQQIAADRQLLELQLADHQRDLDELDDAIARLSVVPTRRPAPTVTKPPRQPRQEPAAGPRPTDRRPTPPPVKPGRPGPPLRAVDPVSTVSPVLTLRDAVRKVGEVAGAAGFVAADVVKLGYKQNSVNATCAQMAIVGDLVRKRDGAPGTYVLPKFDVAAVPSAAGQAHDPEKLANNADGYRCRRCKRKAQLKSEFRAFPCEDVAAA